MHGQVHICMGPKLWCWSCLQALKCKRSAVGERSPCHTDAAPGASPPTFTCLLRCSRADSAHSQSSAHLWPAWLFSLIFRKVLLQPIPLEQIPYLSCQPLCYCKLSSTSFLTAWLLVSSKTVLGFSHKSRTVRPCHMPAPLGSRMSSSHTSLQGQSDSQKVRTFLVLKELLFTLSFPSARLAIPVVSFS